MNVAPWDWVFHNNDNTTIQQKDWWLTLPVHWLEEFTNSDILSIWHIYKVTSEHAWN